MLVPIFRSAALCALFLGALSGCNSSTTSSGDSPPPLSGPNFQEDSARSAPPASADPRELRLSQAVAHLLRNQHMRQQDIDDDLSRKSFKQFLKTLDPDKLFLLKEDIAELRKSSDRFDDQLLSGRLHLAHQASDRFAKRLGAVEEFVADHLAKPFEFGSEEFRETDSEKLDYSANEAELRDRWRRLLKLEALGRVSRMSERIKSLEEAIAEAKSKSKSKGKSKGKQPPEQAEASQKKLEVLTKALAKIPKTDAKRVAKAQTDLQKSYSARFKRLADVDALTPAANFINAIASSFDPHTIYMPPAEEENFNIAMSGELEGIGAVLMEEDHFIGVSEVVAGGASWRQGELEAGDLILAVAQEGEEPVDIGDMKINRVVQMIRGPKDTTVTLTVEKEDGSIKTISIVRDRIIIESALAKGAILERKGAPPMGYIYLPSFYGDTRHVQRDQKARTSAEDVRRLLSIFAKRKIPGVLMDVRRNGGGLLDHSRKMTGYFIKEGPVVQTQLPDGAIEVLRDEDPSITYDGKVVVIIDRFSASASEILAAALQDYGRALVVGPGPTHGKGTVQALLDLNRANTSPTDPPMGVLKLTVQQFFRVNGASTQRRGVVPDIGFPDSFKHLKTGERDLDNSLPWSKVDELAFVPWPKSTWNKEALLAKSLERRSQSEYFIGVEKRADLLKKRQEQTKIPLRRSDYDARVKRQRAEMEAISPEDDKPKSYFAAKTVRYRPPPAESNGANKRAAKDKEKAWLDTLTKDPTVDESLHILADMIGGTRSPLTTH